MLGYYLLWVQLHFVATFMSYSLGYTLGYGSVSAALRFGLHLGSELYMSHTSYNSTSMLQLQGIIRGHTILLIHCLLFSLNRHVGDFDLKLHRYTKFGKGFPKSQNMSPDAFIQIALQFTYYR